MRGSLINQVLGLLSNDHELIRVILGQLEVYMVVNFRTREISRDARKLVWIPTLILKKKIHFQYRNYPILTCGRRICHPGFGSI